MEFVIFLVLNIVFWIVFLLVWRKKYHPDVVLKNIKNEVNMLIVEIDRTIDNDITLVEGQLKALQLAGNTAKNNIEELNASLEKAKRQLNVFNIEIEKKQKEMHVLLDLERKKTQTKKTSASSLPKMQNIYTNSSQQVDLFSNKELLETSEISYDIPVASNTIPQISIAENGLAKKTELRDQILSLFRQGFIIEDIAQKLHISQTEVTLTIEMFG